ncbi:MAG TPA: hypothetical protein VEI07_06375, partial [Planctomycetaceae bacterium]|nr:hypothetical protein [Planctomycetaceae bacterium]
NQTEISGNGLLATTPDDGDGIFLAVGTSQFGYMNASITNNHFSGNANIDFVTQSFTTTMTPSVNALFNTPPGNPTINAAFQPDPVARLALTLTGNVGNTIDVTRLGASYPPFGATQVTDPNKTIPGLYDDPFIVGGIYQFLTSQQNRYRNAQREPGVFNQFGTPIDGGVFFLGGIWGTYAHDASATTPDTVAGAPAPTTTSFAQNNGIIINNGDYVGAVVQFLGGPDLGEERVISSSSNTNQTITVSQAFGVAPVPGNEFTVTAYEQAGTGMSTFVTDSGPSVNTFNHFATVVSDFSSTITFLGTGGNNTGPFTYTWATVPPGTFGTPFP